MLYDSERDEVKGETMNNQQMVKIHDCELYVEYIQQHSKSVTIIMDAGYGDDSTTWRQVADEVSTYANVLLYDRAGLGKSGTSTNRRTSKEMVRELHQLIKQLDIASPFILVGHSFGGVNMQLFASEYRDEVTGLVLVDTTPSDYRERFLPTMSREFQNAYSKQFVREGNYDEFMESLHQVKQANLDLSIPTTIISAGKKDFYSAENQRLWNVLQKEMTGISSNATFVIAEQSAHYIQRDEPHLIVEAIRKLI
jgi:pimeloyl-ACP methyl ester carboxylesterase